MKNLIHKSVAITLTIIALLLAPASSTFAQDDQIKDIKNKIPESQNIIKERCEGAEVTIEVDYDSFGGDADALSNVPYQGLEEISYGVGRYCTDSDNTSKTDPVHVGRIKKIKKILIKFVKDAKQKKVSVQGDTIVIEEAFGIGYGTFGQAEIATLINLAFNKKK